MPHVCRVKDVSVRSESEILWITSKSGLCPDQHTTEHTRVSHNAMHSNITSIFKCEESSGTKCSHKFELLTHEFKF